MALLQIDFSTVEAQTVFENLATGWYRAMVTESEIKPTSNHSNTGNEVVSAKFQLLDAAFKNRPIFKSFNYKNQNQQAMQIGWGEMKALNESLGVAGQDTAEWHNKPVLIHVKLRPARSVTDKESGATKDYDASNEINGFKNINDTSVTVVTEPMVSAPFNPPTAFVNGQSPVAAVGQPWNPNATQPGNAQPVFAASAPVNQPAQQVPTFGEQFPAFAGIQQQQQQQVAAPPAFAAPAAAPVVQQPTYTLSQKGKDAAPGLTMEQWLASDGWTLELMISQGYADEVKPAAPLAPAAPATPTSMSATNVQSQVQVIAQPAAAAVPPWLANK